MSEDYYKLLGVSKDVSDKDLKKAYRKLAMKYHPDQAKGDKVAEEKFKKINEAYAVLSDKEKRKQYDTFGSDGFHQRFSRDDIFRGFDLGEIFKEFGFGGSGNGMRFSFGGGGSPFGAQNRQQPRMKGADLVYELPLTLQEVATGAKKSISFQHQGRTEKISVTVPKGMVTGKKLRLEGKGEPSPYSGPPGDLFIQSKVVGDPVYTAEGRDLYINRNINLSDALMGTDLLVPTIDGKSLSLKIPPGTRHGTKMRLPGHGLPDMKGGKRGNLYVIVKITIPAVLTQDQKKLIEKLAETGL